MPTQLYVVNYDIPVEPHARRRAFYRALHEMLEKHQIVTDKSTQSVWIIDSKQIAREIHDLACSFGSSNLYRATPMVS